MAYTKLANSILTSTIWMENDQTRIVWLTMLAMADQHGEVQASIPGLANVARVPIEACEAAIQVFLSPDPYSRTKSDEGRRLQEIDGGWHILNHEKYRELASDLDRKRKAAERQKRRRDRIKSGDRHAVTLPGVTPCDKSRQNPQAEADTEAKADTKPKTKKRIYSSGYSESFESFWAAFPSGRKQDKAKASKAWNEAIKSADVEGIIQAAREYAASDVGRGEFVKGPAPWLNGRCWEDDRAAWKSKDKAVGPLKGQALIDQNKSALREYAERVENGTVGDLFAMFGAAGGGNGARGNSSNGGSVPGGTRRIDGPGVDGRDN